VRSTDESRLFPIVVKVWSGPERHDFWYIRRSLKSLLASDLPAAARILLIDDHSSDARVIPFLERLVATRQGIEVWRNDRRLGPNGSQVSNFPRVVEQFSSAPFYVVTDDDVVYHKEWLIRLIRVYHEATRSGLFGVFAGLNIPALPHYEERRLPTSRVLLKRRQPALNWLVPAKVYEDVGPFQDTGIAYDTEYTGRLAARGIPVMCVEPSYVQNIGFRGSYQSDDTYAARDYVGRRDALMTLQDCWFGLRRRIVGATEKIPEGTFKEALKQVGSPFRRLLRV
jgi:hypothetical protein